MPPVLKRVLIGLVVVLVAGAGITTAVVPGRVGRSLNGVYEPGPYPTDPSADVLHRSLFVADLHSDALLWSRDLLEEGSYGHVDVPRLIAGNVALQAFTAVTKVPKNVNIEENSAMYDDITKLVMVQRWPISTWGSLMERALYQARKLERFAERSEGKLTIIRNSGDLSRYLARRAVQVDITAGFLGIEGAHALEGDLKNVDVLFDAGFRMMSLSHFFDTDAGGSAHGMTKKGLTEFGAQVVQRMEERGMLLDLAHASPDLIEEVLRVTTKPVVVSHTGVKGTCDNRRNLSDYQLKRIAGTGGLIAIGFWETAVCGRGADAIARAIRYAVDKVGVDHVALGSDFDGAVTVPFDASGMARITAALRKRGFSDGEIRRIMGGNVLRLLMRHLPQS